MRCSQQQMKPSTMCFNGGNACIEACAVSRNSLLNSDQTMLCVTYVAPATILLPFGGMLQEDIEQPFESNDHEHVGEIHPL